MPTAEGREGALESAFDSVEERLALLSDEEASPRNPLEVVYETVRILARRGSPVQLATMHLELAPLRFTVQQINEAVDCWVGQDILRFTPGRDPVSLNPSAERLLTVQHSPLDDLSREYEMSGWPLDVALPESPHKLAFLSLFSGSAMD